jgi:hypothetical protein
MRIGDYRITSDSNGFIVSEVAIVQDGKNKGNEYDTNHTYHTKMEMVYKNLLNRGAMEVVNTGDFKKLKDLYDQAAKLIK